MDYSSQGAKKPIPTLTRENWKRWFQNMEYYLESKDAFWTVQDQISTPLSDSDTFTSTPSKHSAEWRRADALAKYWIMQCVSDDDQDLVGEEKTSKGMWDILSKKYKQALKSTGRELIKEFVNY